MTLNRRQFTGAVGEQLPMFLPASQIVDTFHKGDAYAAAARGGSPREQWAVESPVNNHMSLRDYKHNEVKRAANGTYDLERGLQEGNLPPITVQPEVPKWAKPTVLARNEDRPWLANGHHRLAIFEAHGPDTEVPLDWHAP